MDKLKDAIEESKIHKFGEWKSDNKRLLTSIDEDIASFNIKQWR